MILKIKAFIYRLTGIYLAGKEEKAYLDSIPGRNEIQGIMRDYGMSKHNARGMATGIWQARNGFYR